MQHIFFFFLIVAIATCRAESAMLIEAIPVMCTVCVYVMYALYIFSFITVLCSILCLLITSPSRPRARARLSLQCSLNYRYTYFFLSSLLIQRSCNVLQLDALPKLFRSRSSLCMSRTLTAEHSRSCWYTLPSCSRRDYIQVTIAKREECKTVAGNAAALATNALFDAEVSAATEQERRTI